MQPFHSTESSKFAHENIAEAAVPGDIVIYNTKEDSY